MNIEKDLKAERAWWIEELKTKDSKGENGIQLGGAGLCKILSFILSSLENNPRVFNL